MGRSSHCKKAVADENGLLPDYSEEVRIFKFSKNRPQAPLRMIRDVFHRAFPHDTEAVERSPELDGFDPEKSSSKLKAHVAVVFLPLTDYCQEAFEKY